MKRSPSYFHCLYSRRWRTVLALIADMFGISGTLARAAGSRPCDTYASYGTPCVAAHSTVRALFSSYSEKLYQVKRWSDSATTTIGTITVDQTKWPGGMQAVATSIRKKGLKDDIYTDAGRNGCGDTSQDSYNSCLHLFNATRRF